MKEREREKKKDARWQNHYEIAVKKKSKIVTHVL